MYEIKSCDEISDDEFRLVIREIVHDNLSFNEPVDTAEVFHRVLMAFYDADWSDYDLAEIVESDIIPQVIESIINHRVTKISLRDIWNYFTGGESDLLEDITYSIKWNSSIYPANGEEKNDN